MMCEPLEDSLRDAGCDESLAKQMCELNRDGRSRDMERLLQRHRQSLLDNIHAEQRKLDCLDSLMYHVTKRAERA